MYFFHRFLLFSDLEILQRINLIHLEHRPTVEQKGLTSNKGPIVNTESIFNILLRVLVAIDKVWIGIWIY
jgi:hypothetical protein